MKLARKLKSFINKSVGIEIDEKSCLDVDIHDVYDNENNTYKVCGQYMATKREKERVVSEYEKNVRKYAILQQIDELDKNVLAELESYAHTYIDTTKHKDAYIERIKGTGSECDYLDDYEEEIPRVIENIKKVETKQRDVTNDIHSIEGEKAELGYRAIKLVGAQKVVKIIMITLLMIFALSTVILISIYRVKHIDIMMPAVIMILIIGFFGMWVYIFRRYVIHEINKNHRLRQRAVELLNKIKLKYVHHEQFLDYEYKKYRVKSGEMLENRWQSYNQSLKDKRHIHKISRTIISAEEDIERFLRVHQIPMDSMLFDYMEYYQNKESRKCYNQEIQKNINTLRNTIEEYDKEIMLITKLLQDVREQDNSIEQSITKMIDRLNL